MSKDRLSTTEQVIDTIISGIDKGSFKTGQRLPSQREMSRLFGVSRTAVREAIKLLEGRGIISSRRGSGIFINTISDELPAEKGLLPGKGMEMTLAEIMIFARHIWYGSTAQAVKKATNEELTKLHNHCCEFHENYRSTMPLQEKYIYETSFGMRICKASHNPLNYRIMLQLLKVTTDLDYMVVSDSARYKSIIAIDLKITKAMKERGTERSILWGIERDREIQSIISARHDVLHRRYRLDLTLSSCRHS